MIYPETIKNTTTPAPPPIKNGNNKVTSNFSAEYDEELSIMESSVS